ncbi:MAG: amidohydrolase family protein [Saprospiraceae bacterium]
MKLFSAFIFSAILALNLSGQQVQKSIFGTFALTNGTLHTVENGTFLGTIIIKDGSIAELGSNVSIPSGAVEIDCTGKHIYPGFIDSGCRLGLAEIESISLSNDFDELGDFIPHMRALTAVNPNSVSIPVTRVNGVTTVFAKPQGGLFPGMGALINLHGYTADQMYAGAEGVILQFPSLGRKGRFDKRSPEEIKKDNEKALKKLNDIWENATTFAQMDSLSKTLNKSMNDYNPQMKALLPVIQGKTQCFIEVNSKEDILSAIQWVEKWKIKAVFMGVAEGWRVADEIAKAKIPVITGPVLAVPGREIDRYDVAYSNVSKLLKAGVKVAIRTNDAENVRNLPFNAGFAATYGAGVDAALRAITLTPAEIFGVSDTYGSLKKGKIGNIFVSDGDPFEPKTKILHLFIKGWKIPLESRQTLLNDEFLQRDPGLEK